MNLSIQELLLTNNYKDTEYVKTQVAKARAIVEYILDAGLRLCRIIGRKEPRDAIYFLISLHYAEQKFRGGHNLNAY